MLDVRYPPYAGKIETFRKMSGLKPNFDRNGNEIKGFSYWLTFLGALGGPSFKSGLMRWALFALVAFGANKYLNAGHVQLPPWLK